MSKIKLTITGCLGRMGQQLVKSITIFAFLKAVTEFNWGLKPHIFLLIILFSVSETNLKFFEFLDDLSNCCPILPRHPVIVNLILLI